MTATDFFSLMPLIIIATAAVIVMILIAVKRNHSVVAGVSLAAFALAFLSLFRITAVTPHTLPPLLIIDNYALFYMGLIFAASFAVTLLSYNYLKSYNFNLEEYYILLLLAALGASTLAISQHFVSIFLGLEILSVSLYALIAYVRTWERNLEAGLKYLILAAQSSAFLLFGMALVYASLGSMNINDMAQLLSGANLGPLALIGFALMIVGIGFKLAVVPFHLWTPDVYHGAPAPVTAFIATVSKGGVFALLLRFFVAIDIYNYESLVIAFSVIAIASMIFGNVLALLQNNVKRILAYSSIAHLGYLLVAFLSGNNLSVDAATLYLTAYAITIMGAFSIVSLLSGKEQESDKLEDYRGLFWRRPVLSAVFTAMMFSLAGIPLTAGFIGKYFILSAGVHSAKWLLVIVLVLTSVIGLFYYLRIVVAMYSAPTDDMPSQPGISRSVSFSGVLVLAGLTILLVWFGVFPQGFISLIQNMVSSLQDVYLSMIV
ncbi:MAG: NADH-quinone oxidoreductase subunit NuoN [Caldithrix sp.]|nr:NADH-quinone oxidoreductase subunit NuoN [Caldithrix sp.]